MITIQGEKIYGVRLDPQTRCSHYHSYLDVIAIKFKCCGWWFPCYRCHTEIADHEVEVWPFEERDTLAVLCGACGRQLSIAEYLGCDSTCPTCASKFNPGCARHYQLYFERLTGI